MAYAKNARENALIMRMMQEPKEPLDMGRSEANLFEVSLHPEAEGRMALFVRIDEVLSAAENVKVWDEQYTCIIYEVKPDTENPIDAEKGEFKDKVVLHPMKIDYEKVKKVEKETAKEEAKEKMSGGETTEQ